jgi:hypothetical protein
MPVRTGPRVPGTGIASGTLLTVVFALTCSAIAAEPEVMPWPVVTTVEPQPLIAQARRVAEALEAWGAPLDAKSRERLAALKIDQPAAEVAKTVQDVLDSRAIAAVVLGKDGVQHAIPSTTPAELVEQGWRAFLVKVVNPHEVVDTLRVASPNARPIPNSPAAEVESRWMSLINVTGQPLRPRLSGLGLEYLLVQISSRDAGTKEGTLSFLLGGGPTANQPGRRDWIFDTDTAGWRNLKQCELTARDGSLHIKMDGIDPHIGVDVDGPATEYVLRFWGKIAADGIGEVFWWTKDRPEPSGRFQRTFAIDRGESREYEVRFRADGELRGVRIDPGGSAGTARIDWISLSPANSSTQAASHSVTTKFVARPAIPVTFRVHEVDGSPSMAGFVIRDAAGRIYPAQAKRLAPDFFFHKQVYRGDGETVSLPPGLYTLDCSHGPESIPERKGFAVKDQPVTVEYQVKRWIDPSKRGWWSGDHHIHSAGCLHYENPTEGVHPPDMLRHTMGEDLKVGCCLTWGPCFDYQKRFFTGKPDDVSKYPYILRYDVEVSGFGSHVSGHLNLLKLKEQIPPGGDSKHHWPTLGMNTLRWAKKQGSITGPAHSANGLTNTVGAVEGFKDGPLGLPNYRIPAFDGIGANEFIVQAALSVPGPDGTPVPAVDFISTMDTDRVAELNMWYHVMNCGLTVRASGETDFPCISGERVGMGRVYVKLDGKLDFDAWVDGLAAGRSYVSDGLCHLMDFTADVNGSQVAVGTGTSRLELARPGVVRLKVAAAARYPGEPDQAIEVIVNGRSVAQKIVRANGDTQDLSFDVPVEKSSWVALRAFPGAHSNPFFVIVGGKPIRAEKGSALWCLKGIEQCWKMKAKTYAPTEFEQAQQDYAAAKAYYEKVLAECGP